MFLDKEWVQSWYPKVYDIETAKDAASVGAYCAFFVAAITVALIVFSISDPAGLVDASLFAIFGLLIRRMSRVAAILALLLFILAQAYKIETRGLAATVLSLSGLVGVACLLGFTSGVRGTIAYHRFKK